MYQLPPSFAMYHPLAIFSPSKIYFPGCTAYFLLLLIWAVWTRQTQARQSGIATMERLNAKSRRCLVLRIKTVGKVFICKFSIREIKCVLENDQHFTQNCVQLLSLNCCQEKDRACKPWLNSMTFNDFTLKRKTPVPPSVFFFQTGQWLFVYFSFVPGIKKKKDPINNTATKDVSFGITSIDQGHPLMISQTTHCLHFLCSDESHEFYKEHATLVPQNNV